MSQQVAEQLLNNHPNVELGELKMFGLVRDLPTESDPWNECLDWFEYPTPPRDFAEDSGQDGASLLHYSCLCRGYIGHHSLNADGTLTLIKFEYPTFDAIPSQYDEHYITISGDFWLVLKEYSMSRETLFIPFLDGEIVLDEADWVTQ